MEAILQELNELAFAGELNCRDFAMVMEANQRYIEYLEWLETLPLKNSNIILHWDDNTVRFTTIDDMADWLAEHIQ